MKLKPNDDKEEEAEAEGRTVDVDPLHCIAFY